MLNVAQLSTTKMKTLTNLCIFNTADTLGNSVISNVDEGSTLLNPAVESRKKKITNPVGYGQVEPESSLQ